MIEYLRPHFLFPMLIFLRQEQKVRRKWFSIFDASEIGL